MQDVTGSDPWLELGAQAHIILPHPNGWGEDQQRFLRKATVEAGLLSREGAKQRLHFVEEGEASTSFFMATRPNLAERLVVSTHLAEYVTLKN